MNIAVGVAYSCQAIVTGLYPQQDSICFRIVHVARWGGMLDHSRRKLRDSLGQPRVDEEGSNIDRLSMFPDNALCSSLLRWPLAVVSCYPGWNASPLSAPHVRWSTFGDEDTGTFSAMYMLSHGKGERSRRAGRVYRTPWTTEGSGQPYSASPGDSTSSALRGSDQPPRTPRDCHGLGVMFKKLTSLPRFG